MAEKYVRICENQVLFCFFVSKTLLVSPISAHNYDTDTYGISESFMMGVTYPCEFARAVLGNFIPFLNIMPFQVKSNHAWNILKPHLLQYVFLKLPSKCAVFDPFQVQIGEHSHHQNVELLGFTCFFGAKLDSSPGPLLTSIKPLDSSSRNCRCCIISIIYLHIYIHIVYI